MSRVDQLVAEQCGDGVPFVALTEIADYIRGLTYRKDDEQDDGPISVLRANNITLSSGTLNYENVKRVSSAVRVRPNQRLTAGDILICAGSGSKTHVGKVAFIEKDIPETFGGFMGVVRARGEVDARFLFHVLSGRRFSQYLQQSLSTTTINNLNSSVMRGFQVPVPPVEVQLEIVRVLDQFAQLEVELAAELQARTRQFDHYLNTLTSRFGSDGQTRGWSSAKVGDVCRVEKGKTPIQKAIPGAYPLVATTIERRSSSEFQFDGESVCVPLISSKGHGVASVSRVYYQAGKFALGNILAAIIPNNPGELSAEFLYHYLQPRKDFLLVTLMRGGANVSMTVDSLKSVPIFYPSIEEQRRISASLRGLDRLISDESGGLSAELAARRKQRGYYRDKLLAFEVAAV